MDSSGIGVFMGRYKTIHKRGGQFSIANINSQLARILEMSGLYRILKVYDTVEQAIEMAWYCKVSYEKTELKKSSSEP